MAFNCIVKGFTAFITDKDLSCGHSYYAKVISDTQTIKKKTQKIFHLYDLISQWLLRRKKKSFSVNYKLLFWVKLRHTVENAIVFLI